MSKFYTTSTQAKELCDGAKAAKEKNKELANEVLLKKGEVIKQSKEVTRLLAIETKLKNEVEELKADYVKKESRISHLEVKVQELTSSLKKVKEEAIAAFMKSNDFTTCLNRYYAIGYEDFCVDAKETYPEMDFDSFKIPTTTESSLLPTSSEDVNIVDDAPTEPAKDATAANKDDPKSGVEAPSGLFQSFISFLENLFIFVC